jgi:choline kinase
VRDLVGVILAAGTGTRLQPLTNSSPKCLLEVGGRSILDRLLHALGAAGLPRAIVVTGHLSGRIGAYLAGARLGIDVVTVDNPAYAATNNAVSLAAARSAIGDRDFVLCDGDVVFSVNPFPALLASPDACVVAIDAAAPFNAEAMKVALAADGRVKTLSKGLTEAESAGESLGIQRIGGDALPRLWDALDATIARDAVHAYYEDAFQQLLDRGLGMGVSRIAAGTCIEIDDAADLAAARRMIVGTA